MERRRIKKRSDSIHHRKGERDKVIAFQQLFRFHSKEQSVRLRAINEFIEVESGAAGMRGDKGEGRRIEQWQRNGSAKTGGGGGEMTDDYRVEERPTMSCVAFINETRGDLSLDSGLRPAAPALRVH